MNLSSLAERASTDERVIIPRAGKALVEVVPVRSERRQIEFGTLEGKIHITGDLTDLDEEIARSFNKTICTSDFAGISRPVMGDGQFASTGRGGTQSHEVAG